MVADKNLKMQILDITGLSGTLFSYLCILVNRQNLEKFGSYVLPLFPDLDNQPTNHQPTAVFSTGVENMGGGTSKFDGGA